MNPGLSVSTSCSRTKRGVKEVLYLAQCLAQGRCWGTQAGFMEERLPLPQPPTTGTMIPLSLEAVKSEVMAAVM